MRTGRRPDTIDEERSIAERVRKLEVMPNPRTLTPAAWTPTYEDLYAIAGHIYMLGCFDDPYHTTAGPIYAHPGQAAHHLWAQLDQRGFANEAEGQDWTVFLRRMGALPTHRRLRTIPLRFEARSPTAEEQAEARASFYGPFVRLGYNGRQDLPGNHVLQSRALYFAGFPDRGSAWEWALEDPVMPDLSSYYLWDGTGPIDEGVFWWRDANPVGAQIGHAWVDPRPDPEPDQLIGCGPVPPPYSSYLFPGIPLGPFAQTSTYPCPGMPDGHPIDPVGQILRYRIVLPGSAMYLICPPRIQDPGLLSNDFWHPVETNGGTPITAGPGLQWLADGAAAILTDHPHVTSFYANALPRAYAAKNQAHHHNWQQLEVSVTCRGRIEGQYQTDRVILRGAVQCYSILLPSAAQGLFKWPDEWPHPAATDIHGVYNAVDATAGHVAPLEYLPGTRMFALNAQWSADNEGPRQIRLDGIVIPLELEA